MRTALFAAVAVAFTLPAHGCRRPVVTVDAAPDQSAETAESAALVEVQYDLFIRRGSEAYRRGDHAAAIKEFTLAIEAKRDGFDAFINRGAVYQDIGAWQNALGDYRSATAADATSYAAHNNIAWLLATCPDDDIRDGKAAVRHAHEACELTQWKLFATFDTLAAAYAETGDFDKAVEYQQKAIELAPEEAKAALRPALELYENGKPARLKAPPQP